MRLGLNGKIALVTGSSRGIGRGVAIGLAAEGCDLMLTGRDEAALAQTRAAIEGLGRRVEISRLDLREPDASARLVADVQAAYGRLDILVNNAGSARRGDFLSLSDADWEEGYALKFFAHVRLTRAAWPLLVAGKGAMIAIGGTSGRMPLAEFTIGSSVNAAVAAFGKAMADRGKSDGVRVNTIHPSYVETERLQKRIAAYMQQSGKSDAAVRAEWTAEMGFTRIGQPEDVADLVCFLCSDRASWVHGVTIDLDGGEVKAI